MKFECEHLSEGQGLSLYCEGAYILCWNRDLTKIIAVKGVSYTTGSKFSSHLVGQQKSMDKGDCSHGLPSNYLRFILNISKSCVLRTKAVFLGIKESPTLSVIAPSPIKPPARP